MNASIGGNITSKGEGNNGLALYCRSFSVLFFLLLIISIYQRDKYQYITTSQSKEIINYHIIKLEREPGARMPKGQSQRSQNAKRARAKEASVRAYSNYYPYMNDSRIDLSRQLYTRTDSSNIPLHDILLARVC